MELDLAHVRSFLAVVDYGGYHRAAEALHLTQPAVSQHVRRLEQRVGGPLFERRGRGVEVSARGEEVAAELRVVMGAHDRAVGRLSGERPFVMGTIEHFFDPFLPSLLAALRAELGDRPVQLRVDRARDMLAGLAAGEVDAAIVADPRGWPDAEPVAELTLHFHAGDATPLEEPLGLAAYTAPCRLRTLALRRLDALGLDHYIAAESPHLSGVQAAVRNGLGIALLGAGADGVRRSEEGPLSEPRQARLWLVTAGGGEAVRAALRGAVSLRA
jgi:DNA-binding transcriptional LysR family regulator